MTTVERRRKQTALCKKTSFNDKKSNETRFSITESRMKVEANLAKKLHFSQQGYASSNNNIAKLVWNNSPSQRRVFIIPLQSNANCILRRADGHMSRKKVYFIPKSTKVYRTPEMLDYNSNMTYIKYMAELQNSCPSVQNTNEKRSVVGKTNCALIHTSATRNTKQSKTYANVLPKNNVDPRQRIYFYENRLKSAVSGHRTHREEYIAGSSRNEGRTEEICSLQNTRARNDFIVFPESKKSQIKQPSSILNKIKRVFTPRFVESHGVQRNCQLRVTSKRKLSKSCLSSCKSEEPYASSLASTLTNYFSCWNCFSANSEEDVYSISESESEEGDYSDDTCGSENNSEQTDPSNYSICGEDFEQSSGVDGSDISSISTINSLYQDDIINQETRLGLYEADEYESGEEEMENALRACSSSYYDDEHVDFPISDIENRDCFYDDVYFGDYEHMTPDAIEMDLCAAGHFEDVMLNSQHY